MAFDKVSFLSAVVVVIALTGLQHGVTAQEDVDDVDPQWPGDGISPLDSLAYWDSQAVPDEEENVEKQGCCLPKTWTSTLFSEIRFEGGRKKKCRSLRFAETVYVDQNNQRIADDVTVPRGPRQNATKISYIILFNKNSTATIYIFSKTNSKCKKQVLKNAKFRSQCLPQNSTLLGNFSIGAGDRALRSQSWGFRVRDRRSTIFGNIVLTPDNCVPIVAGGKVFIRPKMTDDGEVDLDRKRPQVITVGAMYTNFITQIRDPSVFKPPSYCKKANDDLLLFDPDIDFTTIIHRYITVPE